MASMVFSLPSPRTLFSSTASRVALVGLLLAPAMCVAQNWTPRPEAMAVPQMTAQQALAEWQSLRATPRPSFDRVAGFLMANPDWPNENELKRAAETALDPNGIVPAYAVDYFARFAPTNAGGHLRHALALQSAGRTDEANAAARLAWTGGSLIAEEESALLSRFPGLLSKADHDTRMDRLLWANSTTAAARQMAFVSPARSPEFSARLAMRTRATAAALRANEAEGIDPSLTSTSAGYIYDKAGWLIASGRTGEARALLAAPRVLNTPPADAEKWLELLVAQARAARSGGSSQQAYDIARQVDGLLPAGAAVNEQPLGVRDEYTNLVWLAATTALNDLGRPREAAGLFALYSGGGRSPQVWARGLYWAGRAATDARDPALAQEYFTRAAANFDQFHGQLALERLGQPQPRPIGGARELSDGERRAFENRTVVEAARALGQQGDWRTQSLFLRAIANAAKSDSDHAMAAQLASEIGRTDLSVMIGRSARTNGLTSYVPVAFPTIAVPPGHEDNWTFIHAITRQESQFDRQAISSAGARGMMQLMPATAQQTARQSGLAYNLGELTNDPNYNIMLGSTFFQRMVANYGGSYPLAVAAYNAGPGNVNRWLRSNGDPRTGSVDILDWIEAIPFSETRGYVQRVLENAVVYDTLRPGAPAEQRGRLSYYLGKPTPG